MFSNCNDCGIKLRTEDEDQMGLCERCAHAVIVPILAPIEQVRADLDRMGIDTGPAIKRVLKAVHRRKQPLAAPVTEEEKNA